MITRPAKRLSAKAEIVHADQRREKYTQHLGADECAPGRHAGEFCHCGAIANGLETPAERGPVEEQRGDDGNARWNHLIRVMSSSLPETNQHNGTPPSGGTPSGAYMVFDPYSSIPYTDAAQNDGGHAVGATINGAAPAAYDMAIILVVDAPTQPRCASRKSKSAVK